MGEVIVITVIIGFMVGCILICVHKLSISMLGSKQDKMDKKLDKVLKHLEIEGEDSEANYTN